MAKIKIKDYFVKNTTLSTIRMADSRNIYPLFSSIDGRLYRENYSSNGNGSFLTYQHYGATDLNDLYISGMYMFSSTTPANMPSDVHVSQGAGVLVLSWNRDTLYQIFFTQETRKIYFRVKSTVGWYDWKALAFLSDIPKIE